MIEGTPTHDENFRYLNFSGPEVFAKYKKWCDDYFKVTHRGPNGECRGVGGIFFDDVIGDFHGTGNPDYEKGFMHQVSCASSICDSYFPIIERRLNSVFTDAEKEWQQIRRGRYVEFNLVYDRGTKFGFATPGKIFITTIKFPIVFYLPGCLWDYFDDLPWYHFYVLCQVYF